MKRFYRVDLEAGFKVCANVFSIEMNPTTLLTSFLVSLHSPSSHWTRHIIQILFDGAQEFKTVSRYVHKTSTGFNLCPSRPSSNKKSLVLSSVESLPYVRFDPDDLRIHLYLLPVWPLTLSKYNAAERCIYCGCHITCVTRRLRVESVETAERLQVLMVSRLGKNNSTFIVANTFA